MEDLPITKVYLCDGCEREFKSPITRSLKLYRLEYSLCPRCYKEMAALSKPDKDRLRESEDLLLDWWKFLPKGKS